MLGDNFNGEDLRISNLPPNQNFLITEKANHGKMEGDFEEVYSTTFTENPDIVSVNTNLLVNSSGLTVEADDVPFELSDVESLVIDSDGRKENMPLLPSGLNMNMMTRRQSTELPSVTSTLKMIRGHCGIIE